MRYNKKRVKYVTIALISILIINSLASALNPDPLDSIKNQVYNDLAASTLTEPTGYTGSDYLSTLDGILKFFQQQQKTTGDVTSGLGSIIDPYKNRSLDRIRSRNTKTDRSNIRPLFQG